MRFSTDRIARQSRETDRASSRRAGGESPLVVFGKRGNLDLLVAIDAAAERRGLCAGLALWPALERNSAICLLISVLLTIAFLIMWHAHHVMDGLAKAIR